MKKLLIVILVASTLIVGCASSRQVTQVVEHVQQDTLYLSNIQYDSIFISQEHHTDYRKGVINPSSRILTPDTLLIREVATEYRYRLLKDTVRIVERDSIPYEVTVTEVKEVTRPLSWFDLMTRACFWFIVGGILFAVIRKVRIVS